MDLLFRNALVFDGSGAPPVVQDVAVRDGRIAAIGPKLELERDAQRSPPTVSR